MSTQHRFGTCLDEFAERPSLIPRFHGRLTQVPRALCRGDDPPRRPDRMKQQYGTGTASMVSTEIDDTHGVVKVKNDAYESFQTSEGVIKLPKLAPARKGYMPTASTLDFLTHTQGSRLPAHPPRYY